MAPIVSMGRLRMGESAGRGFSLPTPRAYRGRVGVAVPGSGIILGQAANPTTKPVVYSIANLPTGLSFNAGTRAITGTPTSAHVTRSVTYTATDSSSPVEVVTATFAFPIVSSTAATSLDDWDGRGYGLSTRRTLLLALLFSGADVAGNDTNVDVFTFPPCGNTGGFFLPSQPVDVGWPDVSPAPIVTRIRLHPSTDQITVNHSSIDFEVNAAPFTFSAWRDSYAGTRSIWLQHRADADSYPVVAGDSAGGSFLKVTTAADTVQVAMDENERFILAVTDTST